MERMKLHMDDPEFGPGVSKTALASMTNPTSKSWAYTAELYLGEGKVSTSGTKSFTIPANSSKDISFPITMPSAEGTYPVFIDVYVAGALIAAYRGTEDIVILAIPGTITVHLILSKPLVEPLYGISYTWDMYLCDRDGENLISHRDFGIVPSYQSITFDIPEGFLFPARLDYPGHNFYLWSQPSWAPAPGLEKIQDIATIPAYGEYNYYPSLGRLLGEFIEISQPQPELTRPLTISFRNMPEGATSFYFSIQDFDLTYAASVDSDHRQTSTGAIAPIGTPMTFNLPVEPPELEWRFLLNFLLNVQGYTEEYPGWPATLYYAQSFDESAVGYVPAFIPGYGRYYFNLATERFER